ncbi:peptide deformylase [candidate division WWE3 bacterium]|nr:peptide deformylase [candidate division WWE3 bacterium]
MALLPIKQFPFETLRQKAVKLTKSELADPTLQKMFDDMMETLENEYPMGAGLAANQIGIIKRFIAINVEVSDDVFLKQILINPEIIEASKQTDLDWEGCLSFVNEEGSPDQWGLVRRSTSVKLKALDRDGKAIEIKAADFYARLLQHEIDHLDGVLFIDKLESKLLSTEELDELMEKQAKSEHAVAE